VTEGGTYRPTALWLIVCIIAAAVLLLFVEARGETVGFSDRQGTIVGRGDNYVVRLLDSPERGLKTVEALFLVNAPPHVCRNVITDYDHYPEFIPNIVGSKKIDRSPLSATYRFSLRLALWEIEYTLLLKESNTENGGYSITWDYIDGDIRETTGAWEIKGRGSENAASLIRYRARVDPGRLVPNWVANRLSAGSVPDMIGAIRERARAK